jgi:hypothetical protein
MGAMGLTAALTGLLTAVVPVVFSLILRRRAQPADRMAGLAAWGWPPSGSSPMRRRKSGPSSPPGGAAAGRAGGNRIWRAVDSLQDGQRRRVAVDHDLSPRRRQRGHDPGDSGKAAQKGPWKGFWQTGIPAGMLDTVGNLFYMLRPHNWGGWMWPRWSARSILRDDCAGCAGAARAAHAPPDGGDGAGAGRGYAAECLDSAYSGASRTKTCAVGTGLAKYALIGSGIHGIQMLARLESGPVSRERRPSVTIWGSTGAAGGGGGALC